MVLNRRHPWQSAGLDRQLRYCLLIAIPRDMLLGAVMLSAQRVAALLFPGQTRWRTGGQRGRGRTRAVLIIRGSGNARQWDRSGLGGDDTSPARLADRPAAADVEGYQIGDCVEGFIFELILRSLVNRVWLNYDLAKEI